MISSLLHLVGLRPRVYYTLTNFRGGGARPPWPPPSVRQCPSYRFWRSILIDNFGGPYKKTLLASKLPPPPQRYAYFRAYLKNLWGPLHRFLSPPPGLPPLEKFLRASMIGGVATPPPPLIVR